MPSPPSRLPRVSVVLPVRNAAATLAQCLHSTTNQTLKAIEIVVVDDGSTEASLEIAQAFAEDDSRVRVFSSRQPGLVGALNSGLDHAQAALIARMDADDVMHSERLARQAQFLDKNPRIDVLGCRVHAFPEAQVGKGMREYLRWQNSCVTSTDLSEEIFVESPFTHPSVMFRRHTIMDVDGYQYGDFPEDYELWLRLAQQGTRFAKLPQTLLDWRQCPLSLSRTDGRYARDAFDRLRAAYLKKRLANLGSRPIVFWGAGRRTRKRCRHVQDLGVLPRGWIDIDPRKIGQSIAGVRVHPPDWLGSQNNPRPFVLVYVASHGASDAIALDLVRRGYRRGEDYLVVG